MTEISEETKENSIIAKDFLTPAKYDIIDERHANFLINRFWTVGFADPYPDDDKHIIGSVDDAPDELQPPSNADDKVYPEGRYTAGNSPYCIYIPNKEVMLKLMRACIKVKTEEDLWIMKNKPVVRACERKPFSDCGMSDCDMDGEMGEGDGAAVEGGEGK